jgi:hypothetical protein
VKVLLLAVGLALASAFYQPAEGWAQGQPSPSPAAKPSPSPSPSPAAGPSSPIDALMRGEMTTQLLLGIGIVLGLIVAAGWYLSNRAEAQPRGDDLVALRQFVEGEFARFVAQGLVADGTGAGTVADVSVANDPAWRKVFAHHLDLHHDFYRLSKRRALAVYAEHIDAAVRRELEALKPRA